MISHSREIYFAGGCFWGIERYMQLIPGVTGTTVGYANSTVPFPSYEVVCTGRTNAVETVRVIYDPEQIDLSMLLELYFMAINPTQKDKQGNDCGTQYRTGIYYVNSNDGNVISDYIDGLRSQYASDIVVEVMRLDNFYPAERYHQDYLLNHPNGYCQIDQKIFRLAQSISPKTYKRQKDHKLQRTLSPTQYAVTQQGATERPYVNSYCNFTDPGIYVDVTTGEPLFTSRDKFKSECGWPSFSGPISDDKIIRRNDTRHGESRIEVRSALGDSHLGHVFSDGPEEHGGLRYCINSAALRFIPLQFMESLGYGSYKKLVI